MIARHKTKVEQLVTLLKGAATRALVDEEIHPLSKFPLKNGRFPKCWARGEWKVFLDDDEDVRRAWKPVSSSVWSAIWARITPGTGMKWLDGSASTPAGTKSRFS